MDIRLHDRCALLPQAGGGLQRPGSLHVAWWDAQARPQHPVALLQGASRPDADAAAPHRPHRCQCRSCGVGHPGGRRYPNRGQRLDEAYQRCQGAEAAVGPYRAGDLGLEPRTPPVATHGPEPARPSLPTPRPCVGGWTRPLSRLEDEEGPNYTNLTDEDAALLNTSNGSFITGYNAQSHRSPHFRPRRWRRGYVDHSRGRDLQLRRPSPTGADSKRRREHRHRQDVVTVADAGYRSGPNLAECNAGGHEVLMPETHDRRRRNPYHKDHFTYRPQTDTYLCPQQKVLTYKDSFTHGNGYRVRRYRANSQDCGSCPAFGKCTSSKSGRSIRISEHEPILQRHRQLMGDRTGQEAVPPQNCDSRAGLWPAQRVARCQALPAQRPQPRSVRMAPAGPPRSISRASTRCGGLESAQRRPLGQVRCANRRSA